MFMHRAGWTPDVVANLDADFVDEALDFWRALDDHQAEVRAKQNKKPPGPQGPPRRTR